MADHPILGRIILDGRKLDADVTGLVTGARLIRRMEGAASLELTLHDASGRLLEEGLTTPGHPNKRQAKLENFDQAAWARFGAMRLVLDGWYMRLGGFALDGVDITLTFEDELAAILRPMTKKIDVSRADATRAEFLHMLLRKAVRADRTGWKATSDRFYSPQEGQRQKIREPEDADRQKGIHPDKHLTVKGVQVDAEQRKVIDTALRVADELRASERATLALIVAGIQESAMRDLRSGDRDSEGFLQVRVGIHGAAVARSVEKSARAFLLTGFTHSAAGTGDVAGPPTPQPGGAISLARKNPDMEVGVIAQTCQGSAHPTFYQRWAEEARKILDAYGGVSQTHTIRESVTFTAGEVVDGHAENYLAATTRLAAEVRWRSFFDLNREWFVTDEWLFGRRPAAVIRRGDAGLLHVAARADVGLPIADIELTVRTGYRSLPPGAVVEVERYGPLDGRWLVWEHPNDLLTSVSEGLILRRPAPKLAEPAPSTRTVTTTETAPDSGSPRAAILTAARKALDLQQHYVYLQARPMPDSLFPTSVLPAWKLHIDCSAFVTLVYKAAGVPNPNGGGDTYTGSGNTSTLRANGTKTNDPQPGDLVHWGTGAAGNASHVGVFIGNGHCIEMGGSGLKKIKVADMGLVLAGYFTYDLGSDA